MRRWTKLLLVILILSLALGACQNKAAKKLNESTPNKMYQEDSLTDSEHRVMASNFSSMAQEISGVNRATVIVVSKKVDILDLAKLPRQSNSTGDKKGTKARGSLTVIVGVDLEEKAKNNSEGIRQEIKEKIMAKEKKVYEVFVVFEAETVGQIDDVAAANMQGESIAEQDEKVKNILDKIKK